MAHTGFTPLPPAILHSSTCLTHGEAHAFLSSFLSLAELDPSLRPDSVLTERGPTSSSSIANPSLALSHLGRIKLGMEGKKVGGDDLDGFLNIGGRRVGGKRKREATSTMKAASNNDSTEEVQIIEDGRDEGEPVLTSTEHEQDWQDREDYDLGQDDDEADIRNSQWANDAGGATNADIEESIGVEVAEEEVYDVDDVEAEMEVELVAQKHTMNTKKKQRSEPKNAEGMEVKLDKEERKRRKKERQKKEKKTVGTH